MAVDPVCGMDVEDARPEYECTYQGRKFSFCSVVCMEEFERDPAAYIYSDNEEQETEDDLFDCYD